MSEGGGDGEKSGAQGQLFYQFNLDEVVPSDHMLRKIDAVLDLSDLRAQLAPYYSHIGRPSIDPELMIRMLLIGYCYGIRSERRLCEEVSLNLAYRWFCRLGIEDAVPDHSTFSKTRHGRFRDADALRKVFETTVRTCMDKGLVGGEGFATDASIIRADANRQKSHRWRRRSRLDRRRRRCSPEPFGERISQRPRSRGRAAKGDFPR